MKFTPVTSGLLIAAINFAIFLALYFAGPQAFASTWLMVILFLVQLVLLVVFGVQARKQQGDVMSYGKAFTFLVLTCLVFTIVNIGTSLLLFKAIDPDFMLQVKEAAMENTAEMLEGFGMDDAAIDKSLNDMETSFDERNTVGGMVMSSAYSFIVWIVVSAIAAFIVKKNKPEFA